MPLSDHDSIAISWGSVSRIFLNLTILFDGERLVDKDVPGRSGIAELQQVETDGNVRVEAGLELLRAGRRSVSEGEPQRKDGDAKGAHSELSSGTSIGPHVRVAGLSSSHSQESGRRPMPRTTVVVLVDEVKQP